MSKRPDYGTATPEDLACALMRPRNRRSGTSRVTDSGARPGRESNSQVVPLEVDRRGKSRYRVRSVVGLPA